VAYAVHGDAGQVQMDFIIRDGAAASYLLERGQVITLPTGESNISPSVSIYLATWEKTKTKNGWFAGSLTANYSPSIS